MTPIRCRGCARLLFEERLITPGRGGGVVGGHAFGCHRAVTLVV